ncbi:MAG: DUF1549 domain-containing protein [Limisphaerales bacterium]
MTKAGCNSGGCHGAATGQGGFRLSLLGYDPALDYLRITRELAGRRVDFVRPEESLLLRKSSRKLSHEGGRRLPADSEDYQLVLNWIAAGAPQGPADLQVTAIEVAPRDFLLPAPGQTESLRVTAILSDGQRQDVTRLALYTSNDDAVADVSRYGSVTSRAPGLTSIMIRYSGQVAAARIGIPFQGPPPARRLPDDHFVDAHIGAELERLGLEPSPEASATAFLRRVTLDLIGRLPSADEARQALSEADSPASRARAIDALLNRPEWVDYWTLQLADLLLLGGKGPDETAHRAYHGWLREQVARHVPLDELVRKLLTAEGNLRSEGPANFFTLSQDPRDLSEHVGRMFLGTRIACARCHAHPNDRWTQDDYHGFAAYFARIARSGDVVQVRQLGEVDHPKTGLPVDPRPLGSPPSAPAPNGQSEAQTDRRVELARWLTAADNPLFARSFVNRVWKNCFGRGLVEPVDDLRPTNPATHPALLDALAKDFAAHGFDLRHLLRTITTSRTYQLAASSTGSNRLDDRLFSHAYVREVSAPVFLDAITQVTGVAHPFEGESEGRRAVELVGPQVTSVELDVLGRCNRERPCDPMAGGGGGLARTLHLIQGSTIQDKLSGGVVDQLITSGASDADVVSELYLRAFTRIPGADEFAAWTSMLASAEPRKEAIEDLLWALLNSREFGFNH